MALLLPGPASAAVWLPATKQPGALLRGVGFFDAQHGLAAGIGNAVYVTSNGGDTWTSTQGGDIGPGFFAVLVDGPGEAWLAGSSAINQAVVVHTTDGGHTFTGTSFYFQDGISLAEGALWGLTRSGDALLGAGYLWDGSGAVVRSTDGENWTIVYRASGGLLALDALGSEVAAVGLGGAAYVSHDGGLSWARARTAPNPGLHSVAWVAPDLAVAVGEKGTVLRSTDHGATWTKATLVATRQDLSGVAFATPLQGYAVGLEGASLRTLDGGQTWLPEPTPVLGDLRGVAVLREGGKVHAWAVGDSAAARGTDLVLA